jgi:hypothetical protein
MRLFPAKLRLVTAVFLLLLSSAYDVAPAVAGLAPSSTSGASAITSLRDADLITVRRLLENKLVAQKLADSGVPADRVRAKLSTMSDQDLHTLAVYSSGLPSGGGPVAGLRIVFIVAVIVLLIIVIFAATKSSPGRGY